MTKEELRLQVRIERAIESLISTDRKRYLELGADKLAEAIAEAIGK